MDLSSLLWHQFVLLPVRFAIFWIFVSANLIVLNSEWRPFSVRTTCLLHVQTQLLDWTPRCFNTAERLCDNVCYTRNHLLYIKPARLTPDIIGHLRRLGIGSNLPRKRTGLVSENPAAEVLQKAEESRSALPSLCVINSL